MGLCLAASVSVSGADGMLAVGAGAVWSAEGQAEPLITTSLGSGLLCGLAQRL